MEILKFSPIFKPTLWGSETWVVSAVKGSESIATNGIDKGLTLPEIVSRYGADFLGRKNAEKFVGDFPLLIKFIGAGMVIAEIQQTSDVTYRIYDYLRRDRDGNLRQLHTELALEAINFQDIVADPKVVYTESRDAVVSLVESPFFTTNELKLTKPFLRDYTGIDSFRVYMCLDGQACFLSPEGQGIFLHQGESLVVPASMPEVTILPDENAKLLESYVE